MTIRARRIQSLGTITNDPTGVTNVHEQDSALYLRADLGSPHQRLTGNFGVRVVRTAQQSVGAAPDLTQITFYPRAGSVTRVPTAAPIAVNRPYRGKYYLNTEGVTQDQAIEQPFGTHAGRRILLGIRGAI